MDNTLQEFVLNGYRIAVDVERTRAYYAAHPLPWAACTCAGCRNFVQAVKLLPEEVRTFFDRLGVDPEKPGETSWFTLTPAEASGDAWYHVCGTILEGGEAPEGQRFSEWIDVSEKFRAAFGPECWLLPEDFPRPCFQMDVVFTLPWTLDENPDAQGGGAMIELIKANPQDCERIHALQVEAFAELLEKYHDTESNPGAEPVEKVAARMAQDTTDYYFIQNEGSPIGAARVQRLPGDVCRVSPIFILPSFQGRGYAQEAMLALEKLYPQAKCWRLDTIKEEPKLCHLYEKLGYRRTGREEILKPGMTIIYYEKQQSAKFGEQI